MSTPAQIAANQANSKFSTGPTSEIGKQIVSQNSVKHHLTGKGCPALPGEKDAFAEYVAEYLQAYAPMGTPEEDMVRSLADNNWRLRRVNAMERTLLIRLETVEPEAFDDALKELRRTSNYGHRIQRTIEKTRAELRSMQSGRKSAFATAQEEAILLTQLAHAKGQTVDVAKDFPSPELCGGFLRKYRRHKHQAFPEPALRLRDALEGRGEVGGVSRTVMPSLPSRRTWC